MGIQEIAEFFKPEVRHRGEAEFFAGRVLLSQVSETSVQGYVQRKFKIALATDDIASEALTAKCSCPQSAKILCRHIWSVLLALDAQGADFLSMKTVIVQSSTATKTKTKSSAALERDAAYKEKQSEYRRMQYQKVKLLHKNRKLKAELAAAPQVRPNYPEAVWAALEFFSENGFPMAHSLNDENLNVSWKKLAAIFHPDKGGSHDEAVLLNENFLVLRKFLAR